jgi:G3E family GTPase
MDWWVICAVLVVSYAVSHVLVVLLQRLRLRRITRKSKNLCDVNGDEDAAAQVPITLITGFLGSGKTTLVNRVLASPDHGLRVLVIENELGAISIDHELIDQRRQAAMPEGVIVLKNGCMCCSGETPGSELERVLDKLLEVSQLSCDEPASTAGAADAAAAAGGAAGGAASGRRRGAARALPFDYVLIETTGLADPSPLVQVLARREMARSPFYLDAVVALVDAAHILRHLRPSGAWGFARRRGEAEKQLALADRIVLNKVDLLPDDAAATAVLAAVRAVNASAYVLRAQRADVPLRELLELRAFSSARWLSHAGKALEKSHPRDAAHAASVVCVSLSLDVPIALPKLQAWLQQLIEARHDDVYRLKAVLHIAGHDERFVLHGVHADVHGRFERPWGAAEKRHSAMVVIGHRLDRAALTAAFDATADAADAAGACAACDDAPPELSEPPHGRPKRE